MKLPFSISKSQAPTKPRISPPTLPILRRDYSPDAVYVLPRVKDVRSGETMPFDWAAAQYSRAVIVGSAGSGKTSALSFLSNGATVLSLADVHPGALPPNLSDSLILLDDVHASHADYLSRLALEAPKARIFASAGDGNCVPSDFALVSLQSFNEREICSAARAWFPADHPATHGGFQVVSRASEAFVAAVKADQRTRLLASNPLNLFLLLQVYTKGEHLPTRRAALFDAYVSSLLRVETTGRQYVGRTPAPSGDPDFAAQALEGIALATKRGELAKTEHLTRGYGFLRATHSGRVEFVHPLLEDFLAARALRRNPEPAPLLEHVLDDDWREVVLFYAGLGDPRALVQALMDRDRLDFAAAALAKTPEIPGDLQDRVVEALIKRSWENQDVRAIDGLSALRSNAATDFFAARLKDRDPLARARAAFILGQLNAERAVEYLLPQLRDTNSAVRDQVIASLGQSTSDRVIEPLLVALRGDSRVGAVDTRMRVAAARALGEVGTEKAVPALIVDLQVGEPEVRAEAVKALVNIRSELARKPLQAILDSNQSSEVRAAAEQVLERL